MGELVPSQATLHSGRRTTPLLGLGLVDAVPDGAFAILAALERRLFPAEAGRVGMVHDIAANRDRPGRFGWTHGLRRARPPRPQRPAPVPGVAVIP